ncbi:bifunctional protein tyrosine phosphatase family protein/NAD(P)/FAD-dependent oxidoreductase [Lutimaribacter sp. EGI FJ00015]|uniref:Bifunctional protein tyrosine phosphatase family protein/NAD(P)/FAD-dependent oxidoreductase n=1 Tax=Lutimaribacter degradans TaxID=2945989 RepID=A0ACC6A1B5_9RHOB|nr:bifunctional protein tyrosine phosphatase family protein/NAD(P)/FAD-dependent oxidoreductase [Lutimaribacter sp. EGI FJ00013]MCM2563399.1 bifunctional protein tyrosine phosphatase family protein/NAD(P)/FAD-dependent oxidoreductase [Lutimaribacter sp. EGI FJ00013]MCO0614522.1 bifunctional protein tyrosine phosphatase family protein/NAD(P)/FAD-dependent oxidoreductase [Lutimaribacter sp. EGI FJ00015]MCO0637195.1 bifunctional protein tyrosine phosphatase family protein/NAD(P)/FAD-dependent oxido
MDIRNITDQLSVAPQLQPADMAELAKQGFRSVICNRPDGEASDQPTFDEVAAAAKDAGLETRYLPIVSGKVSDQDAEDFGRALVELPGPVMAYCRTGTRSATLWSLSQASEKEPSAILAATQAAGYDMAGVVRRIVNGGKTPTNTGDAKFDVVIVGAGAAGIAVAASLKERKPGLSIAILDPADIHYYQPGWTMVGAGVFDAATTAKTMGSLIPKGVRWIKSAVAAFEPDDNAVILDGCRVVKYDRLIVCPGLKLDWHAVDGLVDTLGKNGITSNYRYDLAPYTFELVKGLREGRALFTQPPMPIKCAGAPQKAMYLSADHWHRLNRLKNIDVEFMNAGGVLFGVKDYVPALMEYVKKYDATLNFWHNLIAVDGPAKTATFRVSEPEQEPREVTVEFDMMHVTPPQVAPDFIRVSPLADAAGWVDVDQNTLRHKSYDNVWSLGDVMNAPNAKTAAAARMQAPIVAENVVADIRGSNPKAMYNGYGSCPLTVEKGKIVLAEFGYGGTLLPSFPKWLINGTKPTRAAWFLKEQILPPVYWKAMLRGKEWLAKPEKVSAK